MARPEIICLLTHMNQCPEPVGSGKACEILISAGIQVSEATVGRLLRAMDAQGFTQRVGYRGRELTGKGRDYVNQYMERESRRRYSNKLAEIVSSNNMEDLLETLIARRAIEREIARLAALNHGPKQAADLTKIVRDYEHAEGDRIAHGDVAFHQTLAEAADNKVLKAALDLIRQDAQLSPVFGHIRERVHGRVFADHKSVLDAVLERDSLAAEEAMVNHIENLIDDVKKFWGLASAGE